MEIIAGVLFAIMILLFLITTIYGIYVMVTDIIDDIRDRMSSTIKEKIKRLLGL